MLSGVESGLLFTALGVLGGASVVGFGVVAGKRRGRGLKPMLVVGIAAITLLLLAVWWRTGRFPLVRRHEVLLVAAWCLGVGAWWASRRFGMPILAAVAAPTVGLVTLFGFLLVPSRPDAPAPAGGAGLVLHIVLAVLGFVGFTISAGVGVLYVRQIRLLKRDPTAAVAGRVPSLERLDYLNLAAAAFGFPFLALSLLAGWLFVPVAMSRGAAWLLDPTVLTACAGLALYAALFVARFGLGWHGRRIAWLSVAGFVLVVVGYFVASFCTSRGVLHGA
jgi:ABC-type transport system involved in cytochrome c biogenesis permease subunit